MSDTDTQVPLPDLNAPGSAPADADIAYHEDEQAARIAADLEAVFDVPVQVSGRARPLQDGRRRVVEARAGHRARTRSPRGEAIDIYVNNRLVARGEVVLVEDKLGVTMTEIIKAERS